jgi:hypothetical protein
VIGRRIGEKENRVAIKVIQWSTGAIGKTCLRQVIDHPDLELAGLYAHSGSKAGRDAGDIARRDKTGVIATNSVDEIIATPADVVLHLPLNPSDTLDGHDDIIKRLLRSGKSVITTVAHTFPASEGHDYLAGFEAACREGGSVLFGTGLNPGAIVERITMAATTLCCDIDGITVTEVYDNTEVRSHDFVFELMGVGRSIDEVRSSPRVKKVFRHIFGEVVAYVGHAMGIEWDEIREDHEFAVAEHDVVLPSGTAPAGGVVNFRWRFVGVKDGRPFFTTEMIWLCDRSLPGWDMEDGYDIEIRGAPGIRMRLDLVEPEGRRDRSKAMQYAVAAPVIRAIPEVVKAPPGVLVAPVFAPYTPRMG